MLSKKKGSKSFIKTLKSLNLFHPHASHPTSCSALHNENNMLNISSEDLLSKVKCSPEHHSNLHDTNGSINENIFKPASSDSTFHTSSKCSSRSIKYVSKFEHLRHSRYSSTRKVFQHHFGSTHPSFHCPSLSKDSIHHIEGISKFDSPTKSSCIFKDNLISKHPPSNSSPYLPTAEEGTSASHPPSYSSKKILGPAKTLDLSSHKTILEKTLGTDKTFCSSHLGTSASHKSKDTKCNKSSHEIKSSGTSSPACHPRSTSRSRCSTLSRLVNGEQSLCSIPAVSTFIILLLACLLLLKLLHLPFDRGKEYSIILMC